MKYSSLRSFEKHLVEAAPDHFSSLYAILGKDSFQRKTAYDRLIQALKADPLSQIILEAEDTDPKCLSDALYCSSLFTQKSWVVIHLCEKLPKPSMEWLESYFAKPTAQIFLILTASSLHHGTNFFKKFEKYGIILDLPEEKSWERERSSLEMVQAYLKNLGKTIDVQTAQSLVKQVGTDGETLVQELEKLFCYVGERPNIVERDVAAICTGINSETIWQLGEAVFKLDAPTALRIAHALLNEGTPLLSLLRQLRSQFQTDLQVSAILAKGGSPADVSTLFGYMKGSILDRHCQAATQYGLKRFKGGILKIDEAELQVKNSAPERELLEGLIVRLTR